MEAPRKLAESEYADVLGEMESAEERGKALEDLFGDVVMDWYDLWRSAYLDLLPSGV